jgi:hypothetical protein
LRLGAVDERNPLFGLQRQRFEAGPLERGGGGDPSPFPFPRSLNEDLALADERQRHVRQRRQIAGGSHASLLRHHGVNPRVQQLRQLMDQNRPHAAGLFEQDVGAEQHDPAHDIHRERCAHTRDVTQNQIALKLEELILRYPHTGQLAETGVQPVDRAVTCCGPLDGRPRSLGPARGLLIHHNPGPVPGHRHHIGDAERASVERDGGGHGRNIASSGRDGTDRRIDG